MPTVADIGTLITRNPKIHGGCPIEEIAIRIGHVSVAQVYAALTYYHLNREEIDADSAAEEKKAIA